MRMTKAEVTKKTFLSGQDVIDLKKEAMVERVIVSAEDEMPQEFHNIASELLASSKPQMMVAALLKMHFGGKLNPDSYPELLDPDSRSGGRSGRSGTKTGLVTLGRR